MRFPVLVRSFVLVAGLGLLLPTSSHSQVLNRLRNAAMDEAERQAERLVRDAIRCTLQDSACPQKAEASGEEVIFVDESGEVITDEDGMPITDREEAHQRAGVYADGDSEPGVPGEGVWANYDFVPGDRVLFAEDFSDDAVGDFPRRFDLVSGNWDVVEWQGRRLLRNTGPRHAAIALPLSETLPERFTIEFDAFFPHGNQSLVVGTTRPNGRNHAAYDGNYFRVDGRRSGLDSRTDAVKVLNQARALNEALVTVRIMADGGHVKMYVGEQRVANAPGAELEERLRRHHQQSAPQASRPASTTRPRAAALCSGGLPPGATPPRRRGRCDGRRSPPGRGILPSRRAHRGRRSPRNTHRCWSTGPRRSRSRSRRRGRP
jgi:OmpA-OmpF porin, OOP family